MSNDLEAQLQEMGGDYRRLVQRLRTAYEPMPGAALSAQAEAKPRAHRPARVIGWSVGYLVAASLLVLVGLGVAFRSSPTEARFYTARVGDVKTEYSLAYLRTGEAIRAMIRAQHADGSWANDFLTRQNAEALKRSDLPEARIAYKRAVRNLRMRGIL